MTQINGVQIQNASIKGEKIDLTGFVASQPGEPMNLQTVNQRIADEALVIEAGSQPFAEIVNGQFRLKALATFQNIVDVTNTNLADSLAANYPNGDELQIGDILIIQNFDNNGETETRTFQHVGTSNGDETDFIQAERPTLSDAYIRGLFLAGLNINYNPANGEISLKQQLDQALFLPQVSASQVLNSSNPVQNGDNIPNATRGVVSIPSQNSIAISTRNGLFFYNLGTQTSLQLSGSFPGFSNPTAFQGTGIALSNGKLVVPGSGDLLLLTEAFVYLGKASEVLLRNETGSTQFGSGFRNIAIDQNGLAWTSQNRGFAAFDISGNTPIQTITVDSQTAVSSGDQYPFNFSAADGIFCEGDKVYVGTWEGLYVYDQVNGSGELIDINTSVSSGVQMPNSRVFGVGVLNDIIYIGTLNGIWVYDTVNGTGKLFNTSSGVSNGDQIPGLFVTSIEVDNNKVIFNLNGAGVWSYDPATDTGEVIAPIDPDSSLNQVYDYERIGQDVYLATGGGLRILGSLEPLPITDPNQVANGAYVDSKVLASQPGFTEGVVDAVPNNTTGDEQATGILFTSKPKFGFINLIYNTTTIRVRNGDKNGAAYASRDNGATALAWSDIEPGDEIFWNGTQAGFDLQNTGLVNLDYFS